MTKWAFLHSNQFLASCKIQNAHQDWHIVRMLVCTVFITQLKKKILPFQECQHWPLVSVDTPALLEIRLWICMSLTRLPLIPQHHCAYFQCVARGSFISSNVSLNINVSPNSVVFSDISRFWLHESYGCLCVGGINYYSDSNLMFVEGILNSAISI